MLRSALVAALAWAPAAVFAFEYWIPRASGVTENLRGVCYGGGLWVAVGDSGTVLTSSDAITWTRRTSGRTQALNAIAYTPGTFCAVGNTGTIITSRNAIDWGGETKWEFGFPILTHFRAVGFSMSTIEMGGEIGANVISASLGGNLGHYLPVGGDRFALYGMTSRRGTAPRMLAVGQAGNLLTSISGVMWTGLARATTRDLFGVTYFEPKAQFVVVGDGGFIGVSRDATAAEFVSRSTGVTAVLRGVAYTADLRTQDSPLIAVGDNGTILSSIDGLTWTVRPSGTTSALQAIAVTGTNAVAVGANGTILQSTRTAEPTLRFPPFSSTTPIGTSVVLTATADGVPPITAGWRFNQGPILAGSNSMLQLTEVGLGSEGTYAFAATNTFGTTTSETAAPIVAAPVLVWGSDGAAQLSATVSGQSPFAYQWFKDGQPVGGNAARLDLVRVDATNAGRYRLVARNSRGLGRSAELVVAPFGRMINLSSRGRVRPGDELAAGFVIAGSSRKSVLIRGVGPGLAVFGFDDIMPAVTLRVYRGAELVAANSGWDTTGGADVLAASGRVGAFALTAKSGDAAVVLTLDPGSYTANISGASGRALVEVYEASWLSSRLVNLSTRGAVSAGNPLIAGFVVGGDGPRRVLVRAVGPGLAAFGVADAARVPRVVVQREGIAVASSAGWDQSDAVPALVAAFRETGAFPLERGSADSAVLVSLSAGNYTAEVTDGADGGVVLLEVYELP